MRPVLGMLAGPDSDALGGHYLHQGGAMVMPSLVDIQPIQSTQLSLEVVFAAVV